MKKILYFTAPWCGPCKMMEPFVSELMGQYDIEKINIDMNQDRAEKFNVWAVPTFIVLDYGGNEIKRASGARSKVELEKLFN